MNHPNFLHEIVRDGVRATILKKDQGYSILFDPSGPNEGSWDDPLVFSRKVPAIREALLEAEAWLASNPTGEQNQGQ